MGDVEVFEWAPLYGCPWNKRTCGAVASAERLGILQ